MKLSLGHKLSCQYFLLLTISIDKVFCKKEEYSITDFCTEFDIINLKKAVFENGDNGPYENNNLTGMRLSCWLQQVTKELERRKHRNARCSYSIIDICTLQLDVAVAHNKLVDITEKFTKSYYKSRYSVTDYLNQDMTFQSGKGTAQPCIISEKNFVYGLLYANDNFMMAYPDTVGKVIESYYSNNKVETFWADDECIVHIKTNSPYYNQENQESQRLTGDLSKECTSLLDMGMLIYIKHRMLHFLSMHRCMSAQQIEEERGELANLFCNKLYNQSELDKRMEYFIKGFGLHKMLDEIVSVTNFTSNSKRLSALKFVNYWTLSIALATLVATIIGIIVSRHSF